MLPYIIKILLLLYSFNLLNKLFLSLPRIFFLFSSLFFFPFAGFFRRFRLKRGFLLNRRLQAPSLFRRFRSNRGFLLNHHPQAPIREDGIAETICLKLNR
jgi:hypothetical protein